MALLDYSNQLFGKLRRRRGRPVVVRSRSVASHFQQFYGTAKESDFDTLGRQLRNRFEQGLCRDVDGNTPEDGKKYQTNKDQNDGSRRNRARQKRQSIMVLCETETDDSRQHDQRAEEMAARQRDIIQPRNLAPRL